MFEGFEAKRDAQARKRWFASAGTSAVVYLALGGVVAVAAGRTVVRKAAETLDVTFRADVEPPPPEAAPPPPPPPPRQRAASASRKPGRALVEPTKVSDERAEDVADGAAIDPDSIGDGEHESLKPTPPAPPEPEPEPQPVRTPEPVDVPDTLEPAVAVSGNRLPEYPELARKKGLEGEVLLRLSISETGEVVDVVVLRGAEPFLAAALAAVRTWRYQPPREDGRAIAGTRVVRIPFRIRV
jgi:protein TonB